MGARLDSSAAHELDQRGHRLPLVHRIRKHSFESRAETDRIDCLRVRDSVDACVPFVEQHDLFVCKIASEVDRLGCSARDPRDLVPRLRDRRGAVDSQDRALALLRGEAGDHPRLR